MKKLLLLFVFAGLVFSTTSCKKEDCPTCEDPKIYGAGTWVVTSVKDDTGAEVTDQATRTCLDTDQLVLNESQSGTSWTWVYYLANSSQCGQLDLQVTAWAENWNKRKLYVSNTDGTGNYVDEFEFIDETHIKNTRVAGINAAGTDYLIYTITYEKQ